MVIKQRVPSRQACRPALSPARAAQSARRHSTHADRTFDLVLTLLMENWEQQHRT